MYHPSVSFTFTQPRHRCCLSLVLEVNDNNNNDNNHHLLSIQIPISLLTSPKQPHPQKQTPKKNGPSSPNHQWEENLHRPWYSAPLFSPSLSNIPQRTIQK